jgi:DtxR family Mn-dependent transcriptional regulator
MSNRSTEDYLKAILRLSEEAPEVTTSLLAARLGVAPASVTGMLKKLAVEGLVAYVRYHGVTLTEDGRAIALRVLRYHRLAERYLVEVLGLPWDQVHREAEEWEHVLSERVAGRLDEAMGGPATDPHGEPIPGSDGSLPVTVDAPLASVEAGGRGTVSRVRSDDEGMLRFLGGLGIYPGVAIEVLAIGPYGGPHTVSVAGRRHALGERLAAQIFVAPASAADGQKG